VNHVDKHRNNNTWLRQDQAKKYAIKRWKRRSVGRHKYSIEDGGIIPRVNRITREETQASMYEHRILRQWFVEDRHKRILSLPVSFRVSRSLFNACECPPITNGQKLFFFLMPILFIFLLLMFWLDLGVIMCYFSIFIYMIHYCILQ